MCKGNGFRLIELVVVIAIIGLSVAILMPALQRAKHQAKVVACQPLLRLRGIVFSMYMDDNNGSFFKSYSTLADWRPYGDSSDILLCPMAPEMKKRLELTWLRDWMLHIIGVTFSASCYGPADNDICYGNYALNDLLIDYPSRARINADPASWHWTNCWRFCLVDGTGNDRYEPHNTSEVMSMADSSGFLCEGSNHSEAIRVIVDISGVDVGWKADTHSIRQALWAAGFEVLGEHATSYDATIHLNLHKEARSQWYEWDEVYDRPREIEFSHPDKAKRNRVTMIAGKKAARHYSGADVSGTMTFKSKDRIVARDVDRTVYTPAKIPAGSYVTEREAPFSRAYSADEIKTDVFILLVLAGRPETVLNALLETTSDPNTHPAMQALEYLRNLYPGDFTEQSKLRQVFGENWREALDACILIGKGEWEKVVSIGPPVVQPLIGCLRSQNWNTCTRAARALKDVSETDHATKATVREHLGSQWKEILNACLFVADGEWEKVAAIGRPAARFLAIYLDDNWDSCAADILKRIDPEVYRQSLQAHRERNIGLILLFVGIPGGMLTLEAVRYITKYKFLSKEKREGAGVNLFRKFLLYAGCVFPVAYWPAFIATFYVIYRFFDRDPDFILLSLFWVPLCLLLALLSAIATALCLDREAKLMKGK